MRGHFGLVLWKLRSVGVMQERRRMLAYPLGLARQGSAEDMRRAARLSGVAA